MFSFCSIVLDALGIGDAPMLLDVSADVPPPNQLTNVFVGLRPAKSIARQLRAEVDRICDAGDIGKARRPADILHTTLLPIGLAPGRMPIKILELIDAAIAQVRFPVVDIRFDRAMSFNSRKPNAPFVLTDSVGAAEPIALHLATRDALQVRGFRVPPPRRMACHMTLAYDSRRSPKYAIDPLFWRATELQLIESWHGKTKYVQLASWPLGNDDSGSFRLIGPCTSACK